MGSLRRGHALQRRTKQRNVPAKIISHSATKLVSEIFLSPSQQKSLHKRFFIQDFVVLLDTRLSVFFDLKVPCRHDFTTLCQQ